MHLRNLRFYFPHSGLQVVPLEPKATTLPKTKKSGNLVVEKAQIHLPNTTRRAERCMIPTKDWVETCPTTHTHTKGIETRVDAASCYSGQQEWDAREVKPCVRLRISERIEMRAKFNDQILKEHNIELGFMSVFARASVLALRRSPQQKRASRATRSSTAIMSILAWQWLLPRVSSGLMQRQRDSWILRKESRNGKKACDGKLTIEDIASGSFTMFIFSSFSVGTCVCDSRGLWSALDLSRLLGPVSGWSLSWSIKESYGSRRIGRYFNIRGMSSVMQVRHFQTRKLRTNDELSFKWQRTVWITVFQSPSRTGTQRQ